MVVVMSTYIKKRKYQVPAVVKKNRRTSKLQSGVNVPSKNDSSTHNPQGRSKNENSRRFPFPTPAPKSTQERREP